MPVVSLIRAAPAQIFAGQRSPPTARAAPPAKLSAKVSARPSSKDLAASKPPNSCAARRTNRCRAIATVSLAHWRVRKRKRSWIFASSSTEAGAVGSYGKASLARQSEHSPAIAVLESLRAITSSTVSRMSISMRANAPSENVFNGGPRNSFLMFAYWNCSQNLVQDCASHDEVTRISIPSRWLRRPRGRL